PVPVPAGHVLRVLAVESAGFALHMAGADRICLLRLLESEVLRAHGALYHRQLPGGPRLLALAGSATPPALSRPSGCRGSIAPRILQVRELRARYASLARESSPCRRIDSTDRHRVACRDLLLYVSHDHVHRR